MGLQAALEMQRRHAFKTLFVFSDSADTLVHVARHYRDRFVLAAWDYPDTVQVCLTLTVATLASPAAFSYGLG